MGRFRRIVLDLIVIGTLAVVSIMALGTYHLQMLTDAFQPHFFTVLPDTTRAAAEVWAWWGLASIVLGAMLLHRAPSLGLLDAVLGGALGVWVVAYVGGNLLGPIGLFRTPTLWSLMALGVLWLWRVPQPITWRRPLPGQRLALLAFALLAPTMLLLQLGSPVPPHMDVFSPTAAAQRIVTFGFYLPFDNNPYGYYPPLGQIPGTELLYALLALGGGTRLAVLAETAAMLPLATLLILGTYRLGKAIGGDHLGGFASLLLFATVLFRVLPTGHGRYVAFIPVAAGLAFLLDSRRHPLRLVLGGLFLGTAVASHAIIGTFGMVTFAGVAMCWLVSGDLAAGLAALGILTGAALIALPAVAVGLVLVVPYPVLPLLQGLGIAVIVVAARRMPARPPRESRGLLVLLTCSVAALIFWHPTTLEIILVQWVSFRYPILWVGGVLGLVLALVTNGTRQRAPLVMLLAAGMLLELVGVSGQAITANEGVVLGLRDLCFKVEFWYPFALIFPTACLAAWLATHLPTRFVVYGLLALLCYPWRYGDEHARDPNYNQHSIIEGTAERLLLAKWGYWGSTGDRRWAQTDAEMAMMEILRTEIAEGYITPATHIAHLSSAIILYQDVVLFSVYTGVNDDIYMADYVPDPSIVGGRIRPIETIGADLIGKRPPYIVIHDATVNNARLDHTFVANLDLHAYDTLFSRDGVRLLRLNANGGEME